MQKLNFRCILLAMRYKSACRCRCARVFMPCRRRDCRRELKCTKITEQPSEAVVRTWTPVRSSANTKKLGGAEACAARVFGTWCISCCGTSHRFHANETELSTVERRCARPRKQVCVRIQKLAGLLRTSPRDRFSTQNRMLSVARRKLRSVISMSTVTI